MVNEIEKYGNYRETTIIEPHSNLYLNDKNANSVIDIRDRSKLITEFSGNVD